MPEDFRFTPTEELVLEVLAARFRLGEALWPFNVRVAQSINSLAAKGLVVPMTGQVENTVRALLTESGKRYVLSDTYTPPTPPNPELKDLHVGSSTTVTGTVRTVDLNDRGDVMVAVLLEERP